jgi:hypothetical protein
MWMLLVQLRIAPLRGEALVAQQAGVA